MADHRPQRNLAMQGGHRPAFTVVADEHATEAKLAMCGLSPEVWGRARPAGCAVFRRPPAPDGLWPGLINEVERGFGSASKPGEPGFGCDLPNGGLAGLCPECVAAAL